MTDSLQMIPESERAPRLREFLFTQADTLSKNNTTNSPLTPGAIQTPFLYLLFPWIEEIHTGDQRELFAKRRQEFERAGFKGDVIRASLGEIMRSDRHLRECCSSLAQLAH